MKNLKAFLTPVHRSLLNVCLGVVAVLYFLPLPAQIPQNIEVEGESAQGWQYLLFIVALVVVMVVIYLIVRLISGKKGQ